MSTNITTKGCDPRAAAVWHRSMRGLVVPQSFDSFSNPNGHLAPLSPPYEPHPVTM